MRDRIILRIVSLLFFAFLLIPAITFAQSTGSIGGRVIDAKDGLPLVGATIKIEGSRMGAVTNDNGEYVILNVDVGTYVLEAAYMGYDNLKVTNVKISVDQRTIVDFALSFTTGITTEEIIIEAKRKGIDVEQSGRIVESQNIQNSGVRGVTNIASKTAGVVQDERGGSINIRGGRSNENIIIVDGVETTNPLDGSSRAFIPNNLMQEITVLTGGFGAEYGNVLSGVINVSTKSGTDRYTGSLELITDEFTGAWIDTKSQGYNLYNFNIGGPIIPTEKLAKVFNFFGSFERQFSRMTVGSWIIDKVPRIVPNGELKDNEGGYYSWNGRLNINLTELQSSKIPFNFRFGGTVNDNRSRVTYGSNVLQNSWKNPLSLSEDYQFFGRISGNIKSNFFFELQGNYLQAITEQADPDHGANLTWYGDTARNPGLVEYYGSSSAQGKVLPLDGNTSFLYGLPYRVIDIYQKNDVSYIGGKVDATWAILTKKVGDHEIKFGGEYRYHTLKRLTINPAITADLSITDPMDRWYGTNTGRLKTYGYEIIDPLEGTTIADGSDAKHPIVGGFYIRDKVSFADFNFNGGVRVDFFDVNTKVFKSFYTDITGPDGVVASDDDFVDSEMDFFVSPRLGFSFPVTDKIIFVAQYGKMVQMPQLNLLYVNQSTLQRFLTTALQDVIENASLKPTKLTQYEIGFKQQVGDYINLGITAFYKESLDLIGAERHIATPDGKVPVGFTAYGNTDFAISRGLDFYLSMRRMNRLAVDVAYTLSYASGTGSDPNTKFYLANDATQQLPQYVYPLDYDQRHTGNINLDYRFGESDVPSGFLGDVLKNLGLNLLFSFNSGRPYTTAEVATTSTGTQGDFVTSAKNAVYMDWKFRLDMRLDKTIRLYKANFNFYVYVLNLLNTEIINNVFPGTGTPYDNGFLQTATGASRYANDPVFRELWPERIKFFSNWGPPRQIRFGVNISF
jgi:outer membrane receptor protein involved in Fe transport